MTRLSLKLTPQELELLISLAADQVFRREFIDPKMPGYRCNAEEISMGKAMIERLRGTLKAHAAGRAGAAKAAG